MRIFDIGMYDAADTIYYLETGNSVVAVEANPVLCAIATSKLGSYIHAGTLEIVNVAISNDPGVIDLHVCGQDPGSSSIYADRIAQRFPLGSYRVSTNTVQDLVSKYGQPDFIKIDIEGADRECVLSLAEAQAPRYLSFEAPEDAVEVLEHAHSIGYQWFKIIHQSSFRSLQRQHSVRDRAARKVIRWLGYEDPRQVKRAGRLFTLAHSAGPAPWESDGPWYSFEEILSVWKAAVRNGRISDWYDVHAARKP